jgi:galactokinase
LVLDNYSGDVSKIKAPLSNFKILLVDSRVPRFGAESELASRRSDALKGLEFLSLKRGTYSITSGYNPGASGKTGFQAGTGFKDFASTDLLEALGDFPEKIRRRTMHVVEEIRRVSDAGEAVKRSDLASLAKIIFNSHESLRDLYEVSCPEVDWLVKRAQELEGAAGSRLTGLGFGGCTYTIIRRELVEEYKKRLDEYERIFGFRPLIHDVKLATGARIIPECRRVNANITDE